ncbi:transcriptional regulator [Microbulbifer sp. 2304DJ12-6]|uniref:transcriptional regulator n=1 Tax=Microbulbifer sp. 2304DJ12-6 TaxID=3233340 RepID=UPI0039AFCC87
MNAITKAISLLGTQKKIADMLKIPPACVSQWYRGARKVPPRHCRRIEQATNGVVTRYDLRPDIFGPVPEEQGSVAASVLTASLVTDYRGKESTG